MSRRAGGGVATMTGTDFQNRVAAWIAVRILAESGSPPPFGWPARSTLVSLRCEADHPVDDISVCSSEDAVAFIQAKHRIALQKGASSELAKVFGSSPGSPTIKAAKLSIPEQDSLSQ